MSDTIPPLTEKDGESKDLVAENIEKLKQLFPEIVTDGKVDFETLEEVLGDFKEDSQERYSFTWNGKSKARKLAMTPSGGTLRPAPEESVNWDSTENLFIEGDNLEVLKLLQRSYHGKVKMIYIDPPYNTGKDFIYSDDFRDNLTNYLKLTGQLDGEGNKISSNPEYSGRYHTDWLNMIFPRLMLSRELLKDDGVIFISIDENEYSNLKKICDEVYGEENLIGNIVLQTATDNNKTQINTEHEYILCYAKNKSVQPHWGRRSEAALKIQDKYEELLSKHGNQPAEIQKDLREWINKNEDDLPKVTHYDNVDKKGVFHDGDVANTKFGGYEYDVIHPVTGKVCKIPDKGYRFPETTMKKMIDEKEIMFGKDENTLIKPKIRLSNVQDALRSIIYEDGRASTKVVENLLGKDVFKNPKSHFILSRLIEFCTGEDELILDFFAGSGSTGHAVYELNDELSSKRRFLLIQLPEKIDPDDKDSKKSHQFCIQNSLDPNIAELCKERLRRTAKFISDKSTNETDLGFKSYYLSSSNLMPWDPNFDEVQLSIENAIENIKPDRSEQDVLYEILLKYGLDLSIHIEEEEIAGSKVFVAGAGALFICLAPNIDLDVVEGIAKQKQELEPELTRVVFRDSGFKDDVVKTNAVQILKQHGIEDVRSI